MKIITPKENHILGKRLNYVDLAKIIGLYTVISVHSTFAAPVAILTPCFIALFFICSGYTTNPNKPINLKAKAKKLLIPYLACNVALILIVGYINHTPISKEGIFGVFYSRYCLFPLGSPDNLYFFQYVNGPTWFFTAMFISFILLKLLLNVRGETRRLLIAIIYLSVSYIFDFLPILLPWSVDSAPLFSALMYIGILLRKYEVVEKSFLIPAICLILYVIYYFYFYDSINLSIRDYGNNFIMMVAGAILGSISILKFSQIADRINFINKLSKIGHHSICIFGLQGIFLVAAPILINRLHISNFSDSPFVNGLSQILLSLAGGYLIGEAIDRIKHHLKARNANSSNSTHIGGGVINSLLDICILETVSIPQYAK